MANTLALAKKYMNLLDEVYKLASLTTDLDSDMTEVRDGANAEEFVIPKITLQGLANYTRATGYVRGDINLTWETVKANFDRGRQFFVDAMDNEESAINLIGRVASEFERVMVVPEVDAFRFASYAALAGTSPAGATLATGASVVAALRVAATTMEEAEISAERRILYITPTLRALVDDLDTTASRAVLSAFSKTVLVPQGRFYTAITQYDGTTGGQEAGGYIKNASTGKDINFMVINPRAVLQIQKHKINKIFTPDVNQSADAWLLDYRLVNLSDAYDNKVLGIYLHKKA